MPTLRLQSLIKYLGITVHPTQSTIGQARLVSRLFRAHIWIMKRNLLDNPIKFRNMNTLISAITFLLLTQFSYGQAEAGSTEQETTGSITVTVTGLESDEGNLMLALYDSEAKWLKDNIKGAISEIVDGKATITIDDVAFGVYAISTFHDQDSDKKLKTGLFGIPTEPYAASRGAKGRFGPPKWKDAKFEVDSLQISESIKY